MLVVVFFISVTNLALGFGLAVMLNHAPPWRWKRVRRPATAKQSKQKKSDAKADDNANDGPPPPPPTPVVELPAAWVSALEAESIVASSFVEASVQVLRLEVGRYRERMLEIDARLRALGNAPLTAELQAIIDDLATVNQDWLAKQADAAGHLSQKRGQLGAFESSGHELESVLMEQAAQIETTLSNLGALDASDPADASKKLVREICRLVDLAHTLRDRMSESLLSILVADKKFATFEKKFQVDTLTGLANRFGFESLLQEWWRDDLPRQRIVSCVLINVDRLGKLNERFGARRVDWLIAGVSRWMNDQLHHDRGFERAARLNGDTIVLFMGDTGPRNATSAAEKIRQTLEVTTFEVAEQAVELTASFAVVEIDKRDTGSSLINRLEQAMHHAKQGGRNRTSLDEGRGATTVEPPQFQVKARVVRVTEE